MATWPTTKDGRKKAENELSKEEGIKIAEEIERDAQNLLARKVPVDRKALDLAKRLTDRTPRKGLVDDVIARIDAEAKAKGAAA